MTQRRRALLKWVRSLHIYGATLGLVLTIFFAGTGFILNHGEWFGLDAARTRRVELLLPTHLLVTVDQPAIVEKLRLDLGVRGELNTFDVQEDIIEVVFKAPGRRTEVTIHRADGRAEVTHESRGLGGRLGDLHKGSESGSAWKRIIDGVSLLLLLSAGTGLSLLLSLPKRRRLGLIAIVVGLVLCLAVYLALVP